MCTWATNAKYQHPNVGPKTLSKILCQEQEKERESGALGLESEHSSGLAPF